MNLKALEKFCQLTKNHEYLQICELPGLIVFISALPGEGWSEVHLHQFPVWAIADMSKDPEQKPKVNPYS